MKIYVDQLHEYINKEIISEFLVTQKELREGSKDFYVRMKLADKTGSTTANIWNNAKQLSDKFKEGDLIKIKGIVITYNAQIQITVNKVRVLDADEYDLMEFIESTTKDIDKLSETLFGFIEKISQPHLKKLLKSIFEDKEFFKSFAEAPAAKTWHHNYLGGLLEHTVSVAKLCEFLAHQYPADRDLLISGALLHDIGKVFEYSTKPVIEFTLQGRLIGHLSLGDQFVGDKAKMIDNCSPLLITKLRHLILAHHGEYEKASVRLPQTLEAVILHHADNLDAQTVGVQQLIEKGQTDDAEWSEYDRLNNRFYLLP